MACFKTIPSYFVTNRRFFLSLNQTNLNKIVEVGKRKMRQKSGSECTAGILQIYLLEFWRFLNNQFLANTAVSIKYISSQLTAKTMTSSQL